MPKADYPTDRFDDLPADTHRVGAHRAENPRMRGGVVLLWSVVATVVLVALGIFGTLLATGQIATRPAVTATPEPTTVVAPVIDTSFPVLVLNATAEDGLGGIVRGEILAAGWGENDVTAGQAGVQDFENTTVYYSDAADEAAARGLAQQVLGVDRVELSEAYASESDGPRQLVVVVGSDWVPSSTQ